MRRLRQMAVGLTLPLFLLGCQQGSLIAREAALKEAPDMECVLRVVRGAPGVVRADPHGFSNLPKHVWRAGDFVDITYYTNAPSSQLGVYEREGVYVLFQHHGVVGRIVDSARVVRQMKSLERELSELCGIEPASPIEQRCVSVRCPE